MVARRLGCGRNILRRPADRIEIAVVLAAIALTVAAVPLALSIGSAVYQRGLAFLLRTQRPDGSWFVASRSFPIQPYFETGFPHGPDQFISAAATAWAVAALALAGPG